MEKPEKYSIYGHPGIPTLDEWINDSELRDYVDEVREHLKKWHITGVEADALLRLIMGSLRKHSKE